MLTQQLFQFIILLSTEHLKKLYSQFGLVRHHRRNSLGQLQKPTMLLFQFFRLLFQFFRLLFQLVQQFPVQAVFFLVDYLLL